jgi:hypothetical protein
MKILIKIQFIVLLLTSHFVFGQFGQVIISEQPQYESYNIYIPHDSFMLVEVPGFYLENPITLKIEKDTLTLQNKISDGFTGHSISIRISHELEITEVTYHEWNDVIDGNYSEYTVEKIILSLDKNPFNEKYIVGHYILQIREDYYAGWFTDNGRILNPKDNKTSYKIFHGKFKVYTDEEINKKKQRLDSLNAKNDPQSIILINSPTTSLKDELMPSLRPDKPSEYFPGQEALLALLKQMEVDRSQTKVKSKLFITLTMVINPDGSVDTEKMFILEPMLSDEYLIHLKNNKDLISNWKPAIINGNAVRSVVELPIWIKN